MSTKESEPEALTALGGLFSPGIAPIMWLVTKGSLCLLILLVLLMIFFADWGELWQAYCFLFLAIGLLGSIFWLEAVLAEVGRESVSLYAQKAQKIRTKSNKNTKKPKKKSKKRS